MSTPAFKVTEKDRKILDILKQDSSLSIREIARKTMLPITTIHHRIKRLRQERVITSYTVTLDEKKLGRGLTVYIITYVDIEKLREMKISQHELVDKIKKLESVEEAAIVIGEGDIIIKVCVKDHQAYDEFLLNKLHQIKGIKGTKSLSVIHELK